MTLWRQHPPRARNKEDGVMTIAMGTERDVKELAKLALIQTRAVILPRHLGYWDDLAYLLKMMF